MSNPIVILRNVSKFFGVKPVLSNVNLSIKPGDVLGIMGGSGSGKTTLLRVILGVYVPDGGSLEYSGIDLKSHLGFASQEDAFYPRLTVEENLSYFGKLYGLSSWELNMRIPEVLKLVHLDDSAKKRAMHLSGGMKRRLGIAIALIHDPEIVVLDEPTAGLDVILQKKIWDLIRVIHAQGKTLIVSTHNLKELEEHCTSFAFIYNGTVHDTTSINKALKRYKFKSIQDMFERYCE